MAVYSKSPVEDCMRADAMIIWHGDQEANLDPRVVVTDQYLIVEEGLHSSFRAKIGSILYQNRDGEVATMKLRWSLPCKEEEVPQAVERAFRRVAETVSDAVVQH